MFADFAYPRFCVRLTDLAASFLLVLVWAGLFRVSMQAQERRAIPDRMNGPPGAPALHSDERYGSGESGVLDIYQRWVSPARGTTHCPMHPSCSQYAKQAFDRLPWYEAYFRTLERLLRCGNDLHDYPAILVDGEIRWLDPIPPHDDNNDAIRTPAEKSDLRPPLPRSSGAWPESR